MIDSVQITAAETVGVEKRAAYYERSGAVRDMVPNHLAELLSLVAMEPPVSFHSDHLRDKQVELLASTRKIKSGEVADYAVRGQYGHGNIANVPVADTGKNRVSRRIPLQKPSWLCAWKSTTGAGPVCLFTFGQASG